jgi:hypothetical protein
MTKQEFVDISDALVIRLMDAGWEVTGVSYDYTTVPITPRYQMEKNKVILEHDGQAGSPKEA